MHAVTRTYSGPGAKELFVEFEKHKAEIEKLLRAVKGLVSYSLVKTGDGGISLTVCKDKAGTDESARIAGDWIRKTLSNVSASAPAVKEGTVVVQIN